MYEHWSGPKSRILTAKDGGANKLGGTILLYSGLKYIRFSLGGLELRGRFDARLIASKPIRCARPITAFFVRPISPPISAAFVLPHFSRR
jgi:hypothetical protein